MLLDNKYKEKEMKVFISWSGDQSLKVAELLKEWIPCIIQGVKTYFSTADIDKGTRWGTDIAKELEESDFGILCVTKENVTSGWLNFEAGALSKAVDTARVCPLLLDLKTTDITNSPISQFQMSTTDKDDFYKLFVSMNKCMGDSKLEEAVLKRTFDSFWSGNDGIEKSLKDIKKSIQSKNTKEEYKVNTENMLEEILVLLRSQQMILNNPTKLFSKEVIQDMVRYMSSNDIVNHIDREAIDDLNFAEAKISMEVAVDPQDTIRDLRAYYAVSRYIFDKLGFITRDKQNVMRHRVNREMSRKINIPTEKPINLDLSKDS